ncbi:MAG: secretin N-terminal domain-containing protein [Acidobacteriota bacterium]
MSSYGRENVGGRCRVGCGALLVLSLWVAASGCATTRAFIQGERAAKAGDWDLAVSYYAKAVEGNPDRPDYRIRFEQARLEASRAHLEAARAFEAQDQLDFAVREYRKVVDYDGANQEARARIEVLEQTIRDRIEASRPRPAIEKLREQARQATAEPVLNPTSKEPLEIRFTNVQLRDVLKFIADATGINVSYDRDFQDRTVSVELSGVSLEDALNQIMTANQLFYKVLSERSLIVVPESSPKRMAYEQQAIKVFYLSNADATELVQLLNLLVRVQQPIQPSFAANKGNNTITVRATIPMLQVVEQIIRANDRPRAEVVVDVEILEVNRAKAKQYGLDLGSYSIGMTFSPEQAPGESTGGTGSGTTSGGQFNLNTLSAGVSAADFYMTVPSAIIRFLEADSETKVIAKPQLRGSEGEQLTLSLGTEVPVPSTTFTPIVGGGTAYNPLTSFQYRTVGVNVEITPRVTYEGDVIMKLMVDIGSLAGDKNIAGQNLPSFGSRKVTTVLRLRDGESNLLAGLLQETERKAFRGIPGLKNVPGLKQVLSANDIQIEQTDIVMLLTPRVVRTHGLTQSDLNPIYIGTQQNLGLAGPPPLIAPVVPEGGVSAAETRAPGTPPAPGTPVPGPPGTPTIPVVPPGSSPIPGTVGVPPSKPGAAPAVDVPPPAKPVEPPQPAQVPPPTEPAAVEATPLVPAVLTVSAPAPELMMAGGPYTVPISVSGASRLSVVTLSLAYNPRVLRVRLVQEGSFMRQGNATVTFAQEVDAERGRVDVTVSRIGDSTGASGAGLVAAVVFDAVGEGSSALSLSGVATIPGGTPAPLQLQSAVVNVR